MASHSVLSGISKGAFHELKVLDAAGAMTDILTLINSGSSSGTVSSAALPLSINGSGVLSIDLSAYYTQAAMNSMLQSYALISSLHQALRLGVADVDHSNLIFLTEKLELHAHNNPNLKSRLQINSSGDLEWNNVTAGTNDAVATVPYVNSQIATCWQ